MQLKIVLKRLASNIIDVILFLSSYLIIIYLSGINKTESNLIYISCISFILYFAVPILTIRNTFGKAILAVDWYNYKEIRHLLFFKYVLYFLCFSPRFSLTSCITDFPYFHMNGYDKILSIQLSICIILIDAIVFIISLGRYHVIDYLLNLRIKNLNYRRYPLLSLSYILLFFGLFISLSFLCYRNNISFQNLNQAVAKEIYWERYSEDLYHGNKPFVIKRRSDEVFVPSEILSFLFDKEYNQKIIFLALPERVFSSTSERRNICYNLLFESLKNDVFTEFKPAQTKIVLTTIEEGNFFEYYNKNYTYFVDNENLDLGVYGGIVGDTLTAGKYIKFVESVLNTKDSIRKLKPKLPNQKEYYNFRALFNSKNYTVILEGNKLLFDFVKFEDVKMNESVQLNFPPQSVLYRVNYFNIGSELMQFDDNLFYLINARNNVSNNHL